MFTKSLGTVSTDDVAITTQSVCQIIKIFEDLQAGTTDFKIRGASSSDYISYPSGKEVILEFPKILEKGVTIGYIQRVSTGEDAPFVQLEL